MRGRWVCLTNMGTWKDIGGQDVQEKVTKAAYAFKQYLDAPPTVPFTYSYKNGVDVIYEINFRDMVQINTQTKGQRAVRFEVLDLSTWEDVETLPKATWEKLKAMDPVALPPADSKSNKRTAADAGLDGNAPGATSAMPPAEPMPTGPTAPDAGTDGTH